MLRGDLVHPVISGNKLWKLKYNLEEAGRLGKERLVTFGGAFSNHLLAVACAGASLGFQTLGIVRGEERMDSAVLKQCRQFGMQLLQVSRSEYRDKDELVRRLNLERAENYILPEGGTNALAVRGCAEAVPSDPAFDHLFVPVGTAGTLAGFALGASRVMPQASVEGIVVLKGGEFLRDTVRELIPEQPNWKLHLEFHGGGYARVDDRLRKFMQRFAAQTGILLDPIYTGKMMRAVFELAAENYFRSGSSILCVHTGGLGDVSAQLNRTTEGSGQAGKSR
ncbi:MAG: 1-aminocyclopropane-carboxylate deaminase [Verrucomicrobiales bacterium]|nr:1-aminocyclopropane-carboxylate deaminase [Verrucomicrobiales bacterium]